MVSAPGPGEAAAGAARRAPRGRPWDRRRGRRGRRMPCLGGGRRLVWDRSDVVARCDGGGKEGPGVSSAAEREAPGGGARRGRGCGSEGVRSRLGGREGGRRRRDRLVARPDAFRVFSPARRSDPRGVASGGGARSIAARSRSRARAPGRIPRATTPPIVSTTRTNAFAACRVGRGLPARGRPPREGGRAARRLGTTHRRAAKGEKSVRDDSGNRRARAARRLAHLRSASQPRVRVCASIASMGGLVCGARRRFWRARPTAPPSVRKPSHTRNVATCASRTSASWRTQKRTNKQSPKLEFLRHFFFGSRGSLVV